MVTTRATYEITDSIVFPANARPEPDKERQLDWEHVNRRAQFALDAGFLFLAGREARLRDGLFPPPLNEVLIPAMSEDEYAVWRARFPHRVDTLTWKGDVPAAVVEKAAEFSRSRLFETISIALPDDGMEALLMARRDDKRYFIARWTQDGWPLVPRAKILAGMQEWTKKDEMFPLMLAMLGLLLMGVVTSGAWFLSGNWGPTVMFGIVAGVLPLGFYKTAQIDREKKRAHAYAAKRLLASGTFA